jgi:putative phage-type endonuclease
MDMVDACYHLLDLYITKNITEYYKDRFISQVILHVHELLSLQFDDSELIHDGIEHALALYHETMVAPRTLPQQTIVNPDTAEKLRHIMLKPQPVQRTPEWYAYRHNLITASSAHKALGTQASINELICSKCAPLIVQKFNSSSTDGPMHWGVKYEPVSKMYYEYFYKTVVTEYGCIAHDTLPFIGASPDGINTSALSPLYGRMLEIKNPFSRVITGIPKNEYWVQCQLQMEVCDLENCDFLECKFVEYSSYEEYLEDGTTNLSKDGCFKGMILHFIQNSMMFHYEYSPFQCDPEVLETWRENLMETITDMSWCRNIYWKLQEASCVLIPRNRPWIESVLPKLKEVWDTIVSERQDESWSNRLPKKKTKTEHS